MRHIFRGCAAVVRPVHLNDTILANVDSEMGRRERIGTVGRTGAWYENKKHEQEKKRGATILRGGRLGGEYFPTRGRKNLWEVNAPPVGWIDYKNSGPILLRPDHCVSLATRKQTHWRN